MQINYTFIIPHKNTPDLLNICINSIPDRDDVQIIVVDDNSIDGLKPNVCRANVEVIYLDAQKSNGAGHARNIGIAHAKGKWLLFADSDDYYERGFIKILDDYVNDDIDILYFNYYHVDNLGNAIPDEPLQKVLLNNVYSESDRTYIKYRNNTPWTKMVRRTCVERYNMYFEEVPNGNDVLFSLFVASCTDRIRIIKDRLYYYVKTPNSIVTGKRTLQGVQCVLEHRIKHNYFNNYINHPEWNNSILKYVLYTIRSYGFSAFPMIIKTMLKLGLINGFRKEWIYLIEKHRLTCS